MREMDNAFEYKGQSGRERRKLFKKFPFIPLALEAIKISPGGNVLIIGSAHGALALGKTLAENYPEGNFFLYFDNVDTESKVRGIINREDQPCNIDIFPLSKQFRADVLILETGGFASDSTFRYWLIKYSEFLKEAGELYVITHKKWGLTAKGEILEETFGGREIITRGKGGYRILKSEIKRSGDINEETPLVEFSLFERNFSMETRPGLFSWENLDEGTRVLLIATHEEIKKARLILDVGCGWGAIGIVAAVLNPDAQVTMVDVSRIAIEAATANIRRFNLESRVKTFGGIKNVPDNEFDLVLSNPPLHSSREDILELFRSVKKLMVKRGKIFLVIQEGYKEMYEEVLRKLFNAVSCLDRITTPTGTYFILQGKK